MSTAYIQHSRKFYGHFQVVNGDDVIDCHNIGTAVSICDRLNAADVAPSTPVEPAPDLELSCGCLTGGLGNTPAITWLLTGRVERVHNWATARTLADRHPACHALT